MDDTERRKEQRDDDGHVAINRAMRAQVSGATGRRGAGTDVKMLFSVKSVKPVMGPTQACVSGAVALNRLSTNVWFAQNPPMAVVSLGMK